MNDADKIILIVDRSGASVPSGMCAYNIEYQEGSPLVTATITVVIAEQGSEAANKRRAWSEAQALAGRFASQRPIEQGLL